MPIPQKFIRGWAGLFDWDTEDEDLAGVFLMSYVTI